MIIYESAPQQTQHGIREIRVDDTDMQELLKAILTEVKLINIQLSIITDNELRESDI